MATKITGPYRVLPRINVKKEPGEIQETKNMYASKMSRSNFNKPNLRDKLAQTGLTPNRYVCVSETIPRGRHTKCLYIEADTEDGDTVLVDLSTQQGVVDLRSGQAEMYSTTGSSRPAIILPDEYKNRLFEMVKKRTPGVALRCGKNYCVLDSDENLQAREIHYTRTRETVTVQAADITMPIVHIDDIIYDPDAALGIIVESCRDLREESCRCCLENLHHLQEKIDELSVANNYLTEQIKNTYASLNDSIDYLKERIHHYYEQRHSCHGLNNMEARVYDCLQKNLQYRYYYWNELQRVCSALSSLHHNVCEGIEQINKTSEYLHENINDEALQHDLVGCDLGCPEQESYGEYCGEEYGCG